jgi:hypothetical protein
MMEIKKSDFCFSARKIRYKRETSAQSAIRKLLQLNNDRKNPHTLGVYWCKDCQGWHIGHSKVAQRIWEKASDKETNGN